MRTLRSLDPSVRLDETTWFADELERARRKRAEPRSRGTAEPPAERGRARGAPRDGARGRASEADARRWLDEAERDLRAALRRSLAGGDVCVVLHRVEVAGRAGASLVEAATILCAWADHRGDRLLERDGVEVTQLCFLAGEFLRTLDVARSARRRTG